jgi:hypothetical protein
VGNRESLLSCIARDSRRLCNASLPAAAAVLIWYSGDFHPCRAVCAMIDDLDLSSPVVVVCMFAHHRTCCRCLASKLLTVLLGCCLLHRYCNVVCSLGCFSRSILSRRVAVPIMHVLCRYAHSPVLSGSAQMLPLTLGALYKNGFRCFVCSGACCGPRCCSPSLAHYRLVLVCCCIKHAAWQKPRRVPSWMINVLHDKRELHLRFGCVDDVLAQLLAVVLSAMKGRP